MNHDSLINTFHPGIPPNRILLPSAVAAARAAVPRGGAADGRRVTGALKRKPRPGEKRREQVGRPPNPRISRDLTIEEPVKKPMKSQKEWFWGIQMFSKSIS